MKNNQQKNRNHQPSRLGRAPFNTADLLKDMQLIGADIKISDGQEISVPRAEYDDLIADSTVLRIVKHLVETEDGSYGDYDLLRRVLGIEAEDCDLSDREAATV